jgi:hypothetical protein
LPDKVGFVQESEKLKKKKKAKVEEKHSDTESTDSDSVRQCRCVRVYARLEHGYVGTCSHPI